MTDFAHLAVSRKGSNIPERKFHLRASFQGIEVTESLGHTACLFSC